MSVGGVDGGKRKLKPARFTDPVGLHQLYLGRPVIQRIERGQQFFGMIRNLEEPLRQLAPLHQGTRPPAAPRFDLFVGQNGHVDRIPVHDGILAIDQSGLKKIEKKRLLLAVVFGVAGGKFTRPVDRQAQGLHLAAHVGDVPVGPVLGVAADGHCRIFRRHAESVPTHRVQHVVTRGEFIARDHVAHCVVPHIAHMDSARRVREHLKDIILGLVCGADGLKDARLFPGLLPAGFDFGRCISSHRESASRNENAGLLFARCPGVENCMWCGLRICCPRSAVRGRV